MRRPLVPGMLCLLLLLTAACGDDSSEEGAGLDSVSIGGDFGDAPEVTYDGELTNGDSESETLVEGTGVPVVEGEDVLVNLYIGNGFTQQPAYSTYDEGTPTVLKVSKEEVFPALYDAVAGRKVGTRVAVAAPPEDAFGAEGNPTIGIGNEDNVLFIVDIMSAPPTAVLEGPEGTTKKTPATLPQVVTRKGIVTGVDVDKSVEPSKKLQVVTLVEGDGAPVRDDMFATFDYLGQVYGSGQVFDESYTKEPATFPIGIGNLVKAWDKGLVGVKAGSRVMLIAPPDQGYGPEGNKKAGIKGTDTLVFVIDILGVS